MESVKQRISKLASRGNAEHALGLTLNEEFELACLRELVAVTEQRDALVVESNTNLHGAARELNTSWMMHRTMLGAQAALLCISQGDIKSARDWLEGTTDEAFSEMPDDMTPDGLQAWYDGNMTSNDGGNGFLTHEEALEKLRQRAPATEAARAALRAEAIRFAACHLPDNGKYQDIIYVLANEIEEGLTEFKFPVTRQLRESKGANHE